MLDTVGVDVEGLVEGLVEGAAVVVVAADVEAVAVFEQAEGDLESFVDELTSVYESSAQGAYGLFRNNYQPRIQRGQP